MCCSNSKTGQQSQVNIIKINPQVVYDEAVKYCQNEQYQEALEKFRIVKQAVPQFPFIQLNIEQCARLVEALELYIKGQSLFSSQLYEEALKRFRYIENVLQKNFKDCPNLIKECENLYFKVNLQQKQFDQSVTSSRNQFSSTNNAQILELMNQWYIKNIEKINREQANGPLNQNEISIGMNPQQQQAPNQQPDFDKKGIEKVAIYFQCTRQRKCLNRLSGRPVTHSNCGTTAYFHPNGQISCDNNSCQKYFIKEACFSCQTEQVFKLQNQQQESQYEMIKQEEWLADLIDFCFQHAQYREEDKMEFMMKVAGGAFLSMLPKR